MFIGGERMTKHSMKNLLRNSLIFWNELSPAEQEVLACHSTVQKYKAGALIYHCTSANSPGIQIVKQGRVRAFISSPEGRQLTLQRISDNQMFAIGVSSVLDDAIFDVNLETETPCEMILIPRDICKRTFDSNVTVRTAVRKILAARLATTMRILEAITFTSTKSRLANALIEQSVSTGSLIINATHSSIASDIGSAREVVTRLLNQFQADGFLKLIRGKIQIEDKQALIDLRGSYLEYIGELLYPKPTEKVLNIDSVNSKAFLREQSAY